MYQYNFCTLFDSNYLTRGWALYQSLKKHCTAFHLYIFAFDDLSYRLLSNAGLDSVTVISLSEFEDEKLIEIKKERTRAEYCWTCSSHSIRYLFRRFKLKEVTYLDADLFFYNSPKPLFEEMGENSVMITSHRFQPEDPRIQTRGEFCVQFMVFKNDEEGQKVLEWWTDRCSEWCFARVEDGKFGDQKYLDHFKEISPRVRIMEHLGGGLAPWNVEYFRYYKGSPLLIRNKKRIKSGEANINSKNSYPIIFFHFHDLKMIKELNAFYLGDGYSLSKVVRQRVYKPYIIALSAAEDKWGEELTNEKGFQTERTFKQIRKNHYLGRNLFFEKHGRLSQRFFPINFLYSFLVSVARVLIPKNMRTGLKKILKPKK